MKIQLLCTLMILTVLVGCNTGQEETQLVSSAYSGPRAWNKAAFPLEVRTSSDFSVAEETLIQDMGTAWEDAIANRIDLFDLSLNTAEVSSFDSDNLGDSVLGIYRSTSWSPDFSSTALAVTQIYLSQYTRGQISHADIVVNYENYTFRTGTVGLGYDLGTVVLHELGHFIGLDHSPTIGFTRADSVMYPSISNDEVKREPQTYDQDNVNGKYPASGAASLAYQERYIPEHPSEAAVIIIMELEPTGECVHKVKGKTIHTHHVKL